MEVFSIEGLASLEDLGGKLKVLSKAYRWYFVSDEIRRLESRNCKIYQIYCS